jgi:hypothetical protein
VRSAPHEAQRVTAASFATSAFTGNDVPHRHAIVSAVVSAASYWAWQFGHATSFTNPPGAILGIIGGMRAFLTWSCRTGDDQGAARSPACPKTTRPDMSPTKVLLALLLPLAAASCMSKEPRTQTTTTTETSSTVHVNGVNLGRTLTSDRRVITTDGTFSTTDTIYGAVDLAGPAPASQVTARWIGSDGAVVAETTQPVQASDAESVTQFQFAPPAGLAPGTYTMDIVVDGQVVSTKQFTVAGTSTP